MDQYITIIAERNAAVRERNMALAEIKQAIADRDMAILERDAAFTDRDHARMQRDNVVAQLQLKSNSVNASSIIQQLPSESGVSVSQAPRQIPFQQRRTPNYSEVAFNPREVPFGDVLEQSPVDSKASASKTTASKTSASKPAKAKKGKRVKDAKKVSPSKALKPVKKVGTKAARVSKQQPAALLLLDNSDNNVADGSQDNQGIFKGGLSLNDLGLDDVNLPVPFCTCTGKRQSCYKWGKGGWQSACCTTTLSMYPLPIMPNKRNSRMGGRKMSGGAFTKLITRLAAEGRDITVPIDLNGHWARHGTNRYITIK